MKNPRPLERPGIRSANDDRGTSPARVFSSRRPQAGLLTPGFIIHSFPVRSRPVDPVDETTGFAVLSAGHSGGAVADSHRLPYSPGQIGPTWPDTCAPMSVFIGYAAGIRVSSRYTRPESWRRGMRSKGRKSEEKKGTVVYQRVKPSRPLPVPTLPCPRRSRSLAALRRGPSLAGLRTCRPDALFGRFPTDRRFPARIGPVLI